MDDVYLVTHDDMWDTFGMNQMFHSISPMKTILTGQTASPLPAFDDQCVPCDTPIKTCAECSAHLSKTPKISDSSKSNMTGDVNDKTTRGGHVNVTATAQHDVIGKHSANQSASPDVNTSGAASSTPNGLTPTNDGMASSSMASLTAQPKKRIAAKPIHLVRRNLFAKRSDHLRRSTRKRKPPEYMNDPYYTGEAGHEWVKKIRR